MGTVSIDGIFCSALAKTKYSSKSHIVMSPDDAFIPRTDRPQSYDPDKQVSKYSIKELAALFEHLEFRTKDLPTGKLSDPIFITVKPRDGDVDQELGCLTVQGLLDAIEHLEFGISHGHRKFHGKVHVLLYRKIGVD
jgi:hypothetical protein